MIIDYIQLNNFLSHSDTNIRFENGVNIIYGKNGAGKSSIVDAIRFALFDEKRGDKIAELIRSNTSGCSATIGFRLNDRYYEVFRSLGLGKSGNITRRDSWIKLDGTMIAETSEGVTKEIQNGLKIPKDIFLNSVFVRQGEMDALISEVQSKRERLFSKIIGIEALSESAQKLKTIRDSLKLEEARFSSVSERIEQLRAETGQAETGAKESAEKLNYEKEREVAASEAASLADRFRNGALQKKTSHDSLTVTIGELEEKIGILGRRIETNSQKISRVSFSRDEKDDIEKNPLFYNRALVGKFLSIRSEYASLEAALETTRTAIEDYRMEKQKLESLTESHLRFTELEDRILPLDTKIRELQGSRTVLKSLEGEIESEKAREQDILKKMPAPEFGWLKDMGRNKVRDSTGEAEKSLRSIEGERNAMKERLGSLNRQLSELRKNKDLLGDNHRCPVCGSDLDSGHLSEIHSRYQSDEENFMRKVAETAGRISILNEEYGKVEEELRRLRNPEVEKYLASQEEIERIRDSIRTREERVSEITAKVDELEKLEAEYNSLRKEKEELQKLENEFNSVSYVVSKVPIASLTERLSIQVREEAEKKEQMKEISDSIGFEPADEDRKKLEELTSKYEQIREAEAEHLNLLNEMENDRRTLKELHSELDRKKEEKLSMGDVLSDLERKNEEYGRKQRELSDLRQSVAALEERVKTFKELLVRLSREMETLENEARKLEKLRSAMSALEKLRNAFERNGIQALIRKDSSVSINNMTRNYLSSFNFEFDDVRIDENFDIRVINNGVEEPLDSLSGGERISLAIAVRLAIARYLTGRVSTVIMDEPTNFLDEDRRNNLKDIIQYSLRDENMIQQMIMITHHSELTSAADSSFEVIKTDGISSVVQG